MAKKQKQSFNKAARPRKPTREFFAAVKCGDIKRMESILDQYPNAAAWTTRRNAYGYAVEHPISPLLYALESGTTAAVVTLLLSKGANANDIDANSSISPLMLAARTEGSPQVMEVLINHGANLETTDSTGETALFYALLFDNIDKVKLLLNKGANVNAQDEEGLTPLMRAFESDDIKVASLLLAHGADILMTDHQGESVVTTMEKSDEYKKMKMIERAIEDHARRKQEKARQKTHKDISDTVHGGLPYDIEVTPFRLKKTPDKPNTP